MCNRLNKLFFSQQFLRFYAVNFCFFDVRVTAEKESFARVISGKSLSSGGENGTEGLEAWGVKEAGPLLSLCRDSHTVPP